MTIGDVLAVIALILALGASWGATLLLVALAFRSHVAFAQRRIVEAPGRCFSRGFFLLVVVAILAGILNASHAGPIRILAGALLTGLVALAAIGSAGIVRLVSERIQEVGSPMQPFATLTRGAALYVAAGFVPIFGWFLVTPAAAIISVGGGAAALMGLRGARPLELTPGEPNVQLNGAGISGAGVNGTASTGTAPTGSVQMGSAPIGTASMGTVQTGPGA